MLRVPSATAKPGPSIGQALGPLGVNMAQFVKEFNDRTKNHIPEIPLPVKLTAFSDRTFSFECRTPPTSYMIKKCAGLKKGDEARELAFDEDEKHIRATTKLTLFSFFRLRSPPPCSIKNASRFNFHFAQKVRKKLETGLPLATYLGRRCLRLLK